MFAQFWFLSVKKEKYIQKVHSCIFGQDPQVAHIASADII